jgi:hypothetical protein
MVGLLRLVMYAAKTEVTADSGGISAPGKYEKRPNEGTGALSIPTRDQDIREPRSRVRHIPIPPDFIADARPGLPSDYSQFVREEEFSLLAHVRA